MASSNGGRRGRRLVREVVPAILGLGTVAVITVVSSQSALGVVLEPRSGDVSVCATAALACSTPALPAAEAPSDGR